MKIPKDAMRLYNWRRGLRAQYVLNPRAASRTIRRWIDHVQTGRAYWPHLPLVSVVREPVDRVLSAMACATEEQRCPERTVAEYLETLRGGRYPDFHLVPQTWWLEEITDKANLVPMVNGWEERIAEMLGVVPTGDRVGMLQHPKATKVQREELGKIYAADVALWKNLMEGERIEP